MMRTILVALALVACSNGPSGADEQFDCDNFDTAGVWEQTLQGKSGSCAGQEESQLIRADDDGASLAPVGSDCEMSRDEDGCDVEFEQTCTTPEGYVVYSIGSLTWTSEDVGMGSYSVRVLDGVTERLLDSCLADVTLRRQ